MCVLVYTDTEASTHWKALKAEYHAQVHEIERLIGTLVSSMEELQKKREKLKAFLETLEKKVLGFVFFFLHTFFF